MGVCFPSSSPLMSRAKTTTTTKTERKKKKRKKKREERGKKEHTLCFLLLLLLLLRAFSSSFPPLDAIFGRLFPFSSNFELSNRYYNLGFLIFSLRRKAPASVSFAILAHIIIERLFFVLKYKNVCLIIDCCDSRGTFILYREILSFVFDFLIRIVVVVVVFSLCCA